MLNAVTLETETLLGTLYAWLTDAQVDVETMGVFSLIGLAYAFKFLWSPALDRVDLPGLRRLGKRKQWIVTAQLLLGGILVVLSLLDPLSSLGVFSLLAGIGAFASATQDVVIDAWRVDVADEVATIDILSTVFQMGYRVAALVGGALALFMAERMGWPGTPVRAVLACQHKLYARRVLADFALHARLATLCLCGRNLAAQHCAGLHATNGNALDRLPVKANSALPTAGASGGTAGSPTPAGWRVLGTMWVSTSGAWLSVTMG